jgi:hypothetical protein
MTASPDQARIEFRLQKLRRTALEHGFVISADGDRVGAQDAAALIDVHVDTLRHWRNRGNGPAFYRAPVSGCRFSYSFLDLATYQEGSRRYGSP